MIAQVSQPIMELTR